jgi:hypothetical protein
LSSALKNVSGRIIRAKKWLRRGYNVILLSSPLSLRICKKQQRESRAREAGAGTGAVVGVGTVVGRCGGAGRWHCGKEAEQGRLMVRAGAGGCARGIQSSTP